MNTTHLQHVRVLTPRCADLFVRLSPSPSYDAPCDYVDVSTSPRASFGAVLIHVLCIVGRQHCPGRAIYVECLSSRTVNSVQPRLHVSPTLCRTSFQHDFFRNVFFLLYQYDLHFLPPVPYVVIVRICHVSLLTLRLLGFFLPLAVHVCRDSFTSLVANGMCAIVDLGPLTRIAR
jgi:hypothetical protein